MQGTGRWGAVVDLRFPRHGQARIERMERAKFAYLGTVDNVRREIDAMAENVHPDWFVWQGDQGLIPVDEVKRQVATFGKEIIPRFN